MATPVLMPKLGQSVESCIIVSWKKEKGDSVVEGDLLCEIETDKATLEVESPASGTLLDLFCREGDEVQVQANIAVIGKPGEDFNSFRPDSVIGTPGVEDSADALRDAVETASPETKTVADPPIISATPSAANLASTSISPRAGHLAAKHGLDTATIRGTGPGGRIVERDVQAALATRQPMTPLAKSMIAQDQLTAPTHGSGIGGRVTAGDLSAKELEPSTESEIRTIPLNGVRKVIAERMLSSIQSTAQLTLNASADASALLAYRQNLKNSAESLELREITVNDLILFAVSRTLTEYPDLNALFTEDTICQYRDIHLGFAVDTPRGLIVPVIRNANALSVKGISQETKRLSSTCLEGKVSPDELTGGTFTVTNLGSLGIESFTPILNPPQAGILGVGSVNLKPVEIEGDVQFIPHIGLSLTINHQVVDGAPAARFLKTLSQRLAEINLLLAL